MEGNYSRNSRSLFKRLNYQIFMYFASPNRSSHASCQKEQKDTRKGLQREDHGPGQDKSIFPWQQAFHLPTGTAYSPAGRYDGHSMADSAQAPDRGKRKLYHREPGQPTRI